MCQYISSTGMNYFSEFLLVETLCPRLSRIVHGACKPLCPDRAVSTFTNTQPMYSSSLKKPKACLSSPACLTVVLRGDGTWLRAAGSGGQGWQLPARPDQLLPLFWKPSLDPDVLAKHWTGSDHSYEIPVLHVLGLVMKFRKTLDWPNLFHLLRASGKVIQQQE